MKLKMLAPAIAAAALLGTALTGGVAMASTPGTTTATTAAASAAAANCGSEVGNVKAKESVKIRKTRSVSGTALGLWPKGKFGGLCNSGDATTGPTYTLCGKTSKRWYYADYFTSGKTIRGWVPSTCINW